MCVFSGFNDDTQEYTSKRLEGGGSLGASMARRALKKIKEEIYTVIPSKTGTFPEGCKNHTPGSTNGKDFDYLFCKFCNGAYDQRYAKEHISGDGTQRTGCKVEITIVGVGIL